MPNALHFKAGLRVGHPEKKDQNRACGASVGNSLQSNSAEEFEEMWGTSKTSRIVAAQILCNLDYMAEREGFEPSIQVLARITV